MYGPTEILPLKFAFAVPKTEQKKKVAAYDQADGTVCHRPITWSIMTVARQTFSYDTKLLNLYSIFY